MMLSFIPSSKKVTLVQLGLLDLLDQLVTLDQLEMLVALVLLVMQVQEEMMEFQVSDILRVSRSRLLFFCTVSDDSLLHFSTPV